MHYINPPPAAEILMTLMKQVLKSKVMARVNVHCDLESLHKHVDKDLLPRDYGGLEKSLEELSSTVTTFILQYSPTNTCWNSVAFTSNLNKWIKLLNSTNGWASAIGWQYIEYALFFARLSTRRIPSVFLVTNEGSDKYLRELRLSYSQVHQLDVKTDINCAADL